MSISLPTEASKPVTELGKQTILLYGSPKLGKSSFASKAPGSLFLECEPGLNHLEVYKVPTYSWEAFLEACKLVAKGDHNFKTIVIDTRASKYCIVVGDRWGLGNAVKKNNVSQRRTFLDRWATKNLEYWEVLL